MKFGYFCNTTNWNHKPYDQLLNETQEITTYCDEYMFQKFKSEWKIDNYDYEHGLFFCKNYRQILPMDNNNA